MGSDLLIKAATKQNPGDEHAASKSYPSRPPLRPMLHRLPLSPTAAHCLAY